MTSTPDSATAKKALGIARDTALTLAKGPAATGFVVTRKGVSVLIVGTLLIVAAVKQDSAAAGGFDAAIEALLSQMIGPVLVFLVGLGLVVYAVFSFLRTRYAKL